MDSSNSLLSSQPYQSLSTST